MARALTISAGGLFGLCLLVLAQQQLAEVVYRLTVDGLPAVAWLLSAAGIGWGVLRILRVKADSKALAFATSAALGLGIMSLLVLLLGLCGLMSRGVAIGMIVAGLVVGATIVRQKKIEFSTLDSSILLLLAPTVAMVVFASLMLPGMLWSDEPAGFDVLEYHFQIPREWYELGRIVPLKHNVFSFFPFNVEMHYLLAMHLRGGAYQGMYLSQVMHAMFVGMSVVAVMGIGVTAKARALAGAAMGSLPWLMMLAPIGYNEGGVLLFGTLAIVWAARARGTGLGVAGVMAGLACGCKLTAVPILLIGIPLVGLLLRRFSIRDCTIFLAVGLIAFSPWLVRNQVWAGNPVFPEAARILGQAHFTEAQVARWEHAHQPALGISARVTAVWSQIFGNWRWGFALVPLGLAAMVVGRRNVVVQFLSLLLLIQFAFWITFTHVQSRFLILAAPIVAMLVAQVEFRAWRFAVAGASVVSAAVGWLWVGKILLDFPPSVGIESYEPVLRASVLPDDVASSIFENNRPVVLVGEAQAFMYSIPMSRLRYRTVFDVVEWIDPSAPPESLLVLSPVELRRLSRTYANLHEVPPEIEGRNAPFILPR